MSKIYDEPTNADRNVVLQDWMTENCTFMMQAVLLAAIRGPDGIKKDHPVKVLLRWYRRCILYTAFERKIFKDPYEKGGGSFTGPLADHEDIDSFIDTYLRHVDEIPHHFQLHLMHAAEIIGYMHPDEEISKWWLNFYLAIVNDAHLQPETKEQMLYRLGDSEAQWRASEVVTAHNP